jgi:sirohydrochlorin ferrochelatase
MERREGPDYAFNDPLLADALRAADREGRPVIVSLLFLTPGRHAGPDGDISRICAEAQAQCPDLEITLTRPVGDSPILIDILADRFSEVRPRI